MRLCVFNGSPRGKNSNTRLLLDHFIKGYLTVCESDFSMLYLRETDKDTEFVNAFRESEYVILAFPLYTDAMPAIVKRFIELLEPFKGRNDNPAMGFIIQSGFPESSQSRYLERYLIKLTHRLNAEYIGTVIRGGAEGIQMQPPSWTKKLFKSFYTLGISFANSDRFDPVIVKSLAGREKESSIHLFFKKFFADKGLSNFYWNYQLKKNKAMHMRDHQPFLKGN